MKLPSNIREALEATPRRWELAHNGCIRLYTYVEGGHRLEACPLTEPIGKNATWYGEGRRHFGIDYGLMTQIMMASDLDPNYDPELRADIIEVCGLPKETAHETP